MFHFHDYGYDILRPAKKKSWELRWVNDLFIFMRSNFKLKDRMRLELELSTTLALQPERLWQWQLPSRGPGRGSGD